MTEPLRVPMPSRPSAFVVDDVAAHVTRASTRLARRFTMDVAEEALAHMGPMALTHITQRLAETIVHRHQGDIERVVYSYINDRAWAEPIIRAAIDRAIRQFVVEMFASPESK